MMEAVTVDRGPYTHTFTGKKYFPHDPTSEELDIVDIVHAICNMVRYNGHCSRLYTVGQHSWLMSYYIETEGYPIYTLDALLHDAPEAYIGDMVFPLKTVMPEFRDFDNAIYEKVAKRYLFDKKMPGPVNDLDRVMVYHETASFGPPMPDWTSPNHARPESLRKIRVLPPFIVRRLFMWRFWELVPEEAPSWFSGWKRLFLCGLNRLVFKWSGSQTIKT